MIIPVRVFYDSEELLPEYQTAGAAAIDVVSQEDVTIPVMGRHAVCTGIYTEIPEGYKINVLPRSGLAAKYGITVLNSPGLIDHDYRGEYKVILCNLGDKPFDVNKGDRIAQIEIASVHKIQWVPVISKEELSETERGTGGLGSTGI